MPSRSQRLEPLGRRPLADDRGEVGVDLLGLQQAGVLIGEPRLVEQLLAPDGREQPVPVLVAVRHHRDVAVGGAVRAAGRRHDPAVARRLAGHRGARQVLDEVEREHRVEHRHLDALAPAGAFAVEKRGQHGGDDRLPGDLVGDDRGEEHRRADGALVERWHPGSRLDDVVVRRPVLLRRSGAEALRLAVDEPRPRSRRRRCRRGSVAVAARAGGW
ncbi:MAG: hypothetical protein QM733_20545 [Ilumatobacteraceae bacterium]